MARKGVAIPLKKFAFPMPETRVLGRKDANLGRKDARRNRKDAKWGRGNAR